MKLRQLKMFGFTGTMALILSTVPAHPAVDNSWMQHVSTEDRAKTNPYLKQPDAIAAGSKLFSDHCAKCHGADALGRGKKPSLRTKEVQQAADGEIFWLLRNGNLRHGMPSWSSLPEPSRWQLVTYVKSLGETTAP
jgi:mono/diheme cytochrome c family protein